MLLRAYPNLFSLHGSYGPQPVDAGEGWFPQNSEPFNRESTWYSQENNGPQQSGGQQNKQMPRGSASSANFDQEAFNKLAQEYNLRNVGSDIWESKGGLAYGPDRKFGNRVYHVLAHTEPDTTGKLTHTIFNAHQDRVIDLIDEAWMRRSTPVPGDPYAYIIEMGRIIGMNGETAVKIALNPNTINHVASAYPFKK